MNNLSNTIFDYYLSHFTEIQPDKQFHFISRLYLFTQDEKAHALLPELRGFITRNDNPEDALRQLIRTSEESPSHGSKNAAELRAPYFQKYPSLKKYVTVLFRLTFLKSIYGIDSRQLFFELFAREEVEKLKADLLGDVGALAILSTHAINFLYLYERVIKEDDSGLPLDIFITAGQNQYDYQNKMHLQLLIYLYTHCIIGDSQFYYRAVPQQNIAIYTAMLEELEQVIGVHFKDINLDNKFEFLVCAKMTGYKTSLEASIFGEAEKSLSEEGAFLVDKHNDNPQTNNVTLDSSEHRNVLFILANRAFTPLKT